MSKCRLVVKTINEVNDPVKRKTLYYFRSRFSSIFFDAENVKLTFSYVECSNAYYINKLHMKSSMPIVVYVTDEGMFDAITKRRIDISSEYVKLDILSDEEYEKMVTTMSENDLLMYRESLNELATIANETRIKYLQFRSEHNLESQLKPYKDDEKEEKPSIRTRFKSIFKGRANKKN